jgi:hypothetical protein
VRVSFSQQLFGYSGAALPQPPDLVAFALALGQTAPTTAPELASLSYGLPSLNLSTPALAFQKGGTGGSAWWDATAQSILDGDALQQVTLGSGEYLDSITSVYGGTSLKHGGGGGKLGQPLVLQAGEFISSVSGRSGKYVDHLTLVTTDGQQRDGGGNGGGAFGWSLPAATGSDHTVVVGFGGRWRRYVDAIGPMTATFSPATWE